METLYKRAKTGKIVSYQITVETDGEYPVIVKLTGQLDGKKIEHRETISEGKQKRTPVQQAEAQAESDWKKKRDEGYKNLEDLGITACTTGSLVGQYMNTKLTGIYTYSLESCLDQALPQFNTDASGNVKPMLAKTVDWDKVTYPCLVQPKLDGVRCLMVSDNDSVTFLSRSGKEYTTLNHIELDVVQYVNSERCKKPRFILDGEIYSDELTFQEITAAVKKQRDDSLKLKFRAYDIVNDEKQAERWESTVRLVDSIDSPLVKLVECLPGRSREQIKGLHDGWVTEGYEGAMIRLPDGTYGQGQRSLHLLKVKEFDETEFAFKNFEFGQRGVEDLIAVCWDSTGEKEFRAKMTGTKKQKEELYTENDSREGSSMTIKHFGMTNDGLPRFPIGKGFRDHD